MTCLVTHCISIILTQITLTICTLFLIELRYDVKKTIFITVPSVLAIITTSVMVLCITDIHFYHRIVVGVATIPYFILTVVIVKERNLSVLFTYITICTIAIITLTNGYTAAACFDRPWADPIARILTLILAATICYIIRPRYIRLTQTLTQGWLLLYVPPLSICVAMLFWYMNETASILAYLWIPYSLFAIGIAIYAIIFLFFDEFLEKSELQYHNRLFSLQMSALKNQLASLDEYQNKNALVRHDMRHEMRTMIELFRTGKSEEAEVMYEKWLVDFEEANYDILCSEPYLNAVLSIYRRRAAAAGIEFDVDYCLPAKISIDTMKLSIILSNALENALIAASEQDRPTPYIKVKLLTVKNQIGIEIRNSCITPVRFNAMGYPIAQKHGNGLGTRSIVSYTKEISKSAVINFSYKNEEFVMQLLL